MEPKCIVLDEPTAMLDPMGRKEVLKTVQKLREQKKVTVILITHYMEEVVDADKIYVMDHGHVVMEGTPKEIFSQVDTLKHYRFQAVFYTFPDFVGWYAQILRAKSNIFLHDRSDNLIVWILKNHARTLSYIPQLVRIFRVTSVYPHRSIRWHKKPMNMIQTDKLVFEYDKRDEDGNIIGKSRAIDEVDIDVKEGQFIAILGHNGSGKSTFAKHINALFVPPLI